MSKTEFEVGDSYECPEGHKAKIVWINEDKTLIAVKCPRKHVSKVVQGKEVYAEDFVFLMSI